MLELTPSLRKKIYLHLLRKLRNREIAEELCQDVLLKLHSAIDEFDTSKEIGVWVWVITRNVYVDYMRKNKDALSIYDKEFSTISSHVPDPEQEYLLKEKKELGFHFISRLPDAQRTAVSLRIQGHSIDEIAEKMKRSKQAVKCLFVRAKVPRDKNR